MKGNAEMAKRLDLGDQLACIVAKLALAKGSATAKDVGHIAHAIAALRRVTVFPAAYVDGLQDELLGMIGRAAVGDTTHVYLAFHGEDRGSFLKVGVASNVKSRMGQISTGNPLPRLWVFSCALASRKKAERVEAALLAHMRESRITGEWVKVPGLNRKEAGKVVESLSEVAAEAYGSPVCFRETEA